ncbi:MAG: demethylase [Parabacteroides gordonii]|nr:demethylase [Parabacteroides gordonii]
MAKKVDNSKGFLVIEVTAAELFAKAGGLGICDFCNAAAEKGYYIAVLNQWYCPECYSDFCKRSTYHEEDAAIERGNYEFYAKLFGV